jgi:hypothetical protein
MFPNQIDEEARQQLKSQDRYLTIMALRDLHNSTLRIGDEWFGVEGRPIHLRSIYRPIRSFGLQSYRLHLVLQQNTNSND